MFIGIIFSGQNDAESCPTVATDGQDTTATGGCTTEDGDRWEGTIEIHNLPGFFEENPAYDESQPSKITFDVEVTAPDGEVTRLDGTVETTVGAAPGVSSDFTVDNAGIVTTSRLDLACTEDGPCTASADSEIDVSDLGGAAVEGTWTLGDPATGSVTLRGADVLVFDIASRDDNGCVAYSIGSESGTVCGDSGEEPAFTGPARTNWTGPFVSSRGRR